MVINHLSHSNRTAGKSAHRSQKSDKKSDRFEDMLTQSLRSNKKKKLTKKPARKTSVAKRKNEGLADNEYSQQKLKRHDKAPKKIEGSRQRNTQSLQTRGHHKRPISMEKINSPVNKEMEAFKGKIDTLNKDISASNTQEVALLKNQQNLKEMALQKNSALPLSKDSSVALEKTLALNEKKLVQDLAAKQMKRGANIFQPNSQVNKGSQGLNLLKKPEFKIDPKLGNQANETSELLENMENLKSQLSELAKDNKDLSQENHSGLDTSLAGSLEADVQTDAIDKSAFAEKLAEVDGQVGKEEKAENVNSIIKQARAFIKDGGGEMEMELRPEGLGKIQLKVSVENGKAQVEMFADNKLAKTALEDSLADMKMGLESQRLVVDHLKVEMSNDYERDFSQLKDNMMEQEQKEFARQFLNQFRDEKNERWDGMFSGFKNYARTGEKPELSLQPNTQQRAMLAKNKGRSLNVVA